MPPLVSNADVLRTFLHCCVQQMALALAHPFERGEVGAAGKLPEPRGDEQGVGGRAVTYPLSIKSDIPHMFSRDDVDPSGIVAQTSSSSQGPGP
jgi:hypothetical protein